MAKRYFIEIVGIDPDRGMAQLIEAGITPNRILEIDENNPMAPVIDAIMSVSGVTWAEITGNSRKHNVIVARTIYVYNAIKRGYTCKDICRDIKKAHNMIRWYETKYEDCFRFDPSFKKVAQKITELVESITINRKEDNSRKTSNKKLTAEEIEAILDARQLRIQW